LDSRNQAGIISVRHTGRNNKVSDVQAGIIRVQAYRQE
jgi:hypothetical protein